MRAVGGEEGRLGESKVERRSSKDTMPGRSSYSHFVCCYTWCDPHASKRHSSSSFWAVLGGQSGQGANCGWEGAPPGHAGKVDRYLGSPTKFSTHFTPATLRNEPSAGQVRVMALVNQKVFLLSKNAARCVCPSTARQPSLDISPAFWGS